MYSGYLIYYKALHPYNTSKFNYLLSKEHTSVVQTECKWSGAQSWVQWWMRKTKFLAKPFAAIYGLEGYM